MTRAGRIARWLLGASLALAPCACVPDDYDYELEQLRKHRSAAETTYREMIVALQQADARNDFTPAGQLYRAMLAAKAGAVKDEIRNLDLAIGDRNMFLQIEKFKQEHAAPSPPPQP